MNKLLAFVLILFIGAIVIEGIYYLGQTKAPAKPVKNEVVNVVKPTPTLTTTDSAFLEQIKKIQEKFDTLPTCLQKEIEKLGKADLIVTCYDRLEKKFNISDAKGKLIGRYDAKNCKYYEEK